jgi:hypothetical protein
MNSRLMIGGVGIALIGTLVSCLSGTAPTTETAPQVFPDLAVSAAKDVQPRLVGRYYALNVFKTDNDTKLKLEPTYDGFKYQPNNSQFPGFTNWDKLDLPRANNTRGDWLRVTLTRDATLAVLSGDKPGWIDGSWTEGKLPDGTTSTFKKEFKAGEIQLGAPSDQQKPYTVLVAEAGGKASVYPGLPSNAATETEKPAPNKACPQWLNKLYTVQGPDGEAYDSWHPQIDPVYWCYFGVEHGSDPALVNLPGWALGYVARKNNDQAELLEGFKGIAIRDDTTKLGWYINIHSETGDLHRVCTQKHTVVVIVTDLNMPASSYPDNIVARLGYKGDFGASQSTRDVAGTHPVITGFTTGVCPDDQKKIADSLTSNPKDGPVFFKNIRVLANGDGKTNENNGYENWQGGLNPYLGMSVAGWFGGSTQPRFKIDIRNPSTACKDLTCSQTITNDSHGDERTFFVPEMKISYNIPSVKLLDPDGDGTFYTDVYGTKASISSDPKAIKQYIKPGVTLKGPDGGFHTEDAWRGLYVDDNLAGVPRIELERALGPAN